MSAAELVEYEERIAGPCPWRAPDLESLLDRFRELRDGRRGYGVRHHQPFVLSWAAVAVLMGAGGYQAIEDTCRKFTQRQLRALGCQRNEAGKYAPPSACPRAGGRGHWSAIENGVHHRRDVSFGEDACRAAKRPAAQALASLRNLAIGLYEIQRERGRVEANGCKSRCRRMTVATALSMLRKRSP